MSQFLSGGAVDCGPSNALKDVSSLVERDYGVQRDRFTPQAGSSSSSNAFRTRPGVQQQQAPSPQASAFDVSQLRTHLPPAQVAGPYVPVAHAAPAHALAQQPSHWADSYSANGLGKGKARADAPVGVWGSEFAAQDQQQRAGSPALAPWQRGPTHAAPSPVAAYQQQPMFQQPTFQPAFQQQPMYHPPPNVITPNPQYFRQPPPTPALEQKAQEQVVQQERPAEAQQNAQAPLSGPDDELARTARALVDQLGQEDQLQTNEKLNNSQFVQLLRGLGTGSVVVQEGTGEVAEGEEVGDGAKFVAASSGGDWASAFIGSEGGATTTFDPVTVPITQPITSIPTEAPVKTGYMTPNYESHPPTLEIGQDAWSQQFQAALTMSDGAERLQARRKSVHFDEDQVMPGMPYDLAEAQQHTTAIPGATSMWEEGISGLAVDEDLDDDFDTEMLQHFNGMPRVASESAYGPAAHEGWGVLQDGWEEQVGAVHGPTAEPYLFHTSNPYALGSPIVRELSPTTMGVLELEAAVQQDPRDAAAWLALGLKQQENEREDAAIRALAKATQLAPDTREAYLALAVSYVNENQLSKAHASLEKWIELGQPEALLSQTPGETAAERQARIISRLIDIARQNPHDLDVDVQVALGVLFNSSEDYAKAEDCFNAALEARPTDWVLYNRLGATLANSGRSHEAIKYYHKALGMHPNFVRAQFNLGISYINLAQYRLAAQCILDAIRLQHADVTEGYGAGTNEGGSFTKGVTSDALWTTLRMACLHLQRPDLVNLANQQDLNGFPLEI